LGHDEEERGREERRRESCEIKKKRRRKKKKIKEKKESIFLSGKPQLAVKLWPDIIRVFKSLAIGESQ
jgi:hypothetical protein